MPSELKKVEDIDTTTSNLWLCSKKNGQPSEGSILAKAMKNIVKKNEMGNKPHPASKKSCICTPTTHPGSFRCHLHRMGAPQKLVVKLSDSDKKGVAQNSNFTNTNLQNHSHHQLSRFGRAALSGYQHPSDHNKEERLR